MKFNKFIVFRKRGLSPGLYTFCLQHCYEEGNWAMISKSQGWCYKVDTEVVNVETKATS